MQHQEEMQDQEMSMDEILASIRRYVSPDDYPPASSQTHTTTHTSSMKVEPYLSEPPLRAAPLQDLMSAPPSAPSISPNPPNPSKTVAQSFEAEDSVVRLQSASTVMQSSQPLTHSTTYHREGPVEKKSFEKQTDHDSLLSSQTLSSALSSFSKLQETLEKEPASSPTIPKAASVSSKLTLDEIFYELARPMIREWLEANLPTMIEKIVTKEIERITKNRL